MVCWARSGTVLAMDTFGDQGDTCRAAIIEMSQQPESVPRDHRTVWTAWGTRQGVDEGYAIGSAALAAFLLYLGVSRRSLQLHGAAA